MKSFFKTHVQKNKKKTSNKTVIRRNYLDIRAKPVRVAVPLKTIKSYVCTFFYLKNTNKFL